MVRIVNNGRQIILLAASHIPRLARVRRAANAVEDVRYTASKHLYKGETRDDDLLPSVGGGIGPDNLPASG